MLWFCDKFERVFVDFWSSECHLVTSGVPLGPRWPQGLPKAAKSDVWGIHFGSFGELCNVVLRPEFSLVFEASLLECFIMIWSKKGVKMHPELS